MSFNCVRSTVFKPESLGLGKGSLHACQSAKCAVPLPPTTMSQHPSIGLPKRNVFLRLLQGLVLGVCHTSAQQALIMVSIQRMLGACSSFTAYLPYLQSVCLFDSADPHLLIPNPQLHTKACNSSDAFPSLLLSWPFVRFLRLTPLLLSPSVLAQSNQNLLIPVRKYLLRSDNHGPKTSRLFLQFFLWTSPGSSDLPRSLCCSFLLSHMLAFNAKFRNCAQQALVDSMIALHLLASGLCSLHIQFHCAYTVLSPRWAFGQSSFA